MNNATLELRAHHALCLLHWQGRGYSAAFTQEMDRVAALLAASPETPVRLLARPDGLCARCPNCRGQACESPKPARYDAAVLAALRLPEGTTLAWRTLHKAALALDQRLADVCADCQWFSLCSAAGANRQADASGEEGAGHAAEPVRPGALF